LGGKKGGSGVESGKQRRVQSESKKDTQGQSFRSGGKRFKKKSKTPIKPFETIKKDERAVMQAKKMPAKNNQKKKNKKKKYRML